MGTIFLRNGRYYSRLFVPADLRLFLHRREIKKSLGTSYRDAKILSARWEGRLAYLFHHLRQHGVAMTLDQIKKLVQHYINTSLEEEEEALLASNGHDDDDLPPYSDFLEEAVNQLRRNDFRQIQHEADELLKTHKRTLPKTSDAYRRLCRELLKAKQVVWKAVMERSGGNYFRDTSAAYSILGHSSTPDTPSPETVRLLSETFTDYFKHYVHRDKRTNHEKTILFQRFVESLGGDRPIQEVTKADCIRFRDQYSRLPKRPTNNLRGKPIAVILEAMEGATYPTVTKTTVNLALDDLRHFFSWALKHDVYMGKNPVEGIAYEGTKKQSYEYLEDADLKALFTSTEFNDQRNGEYPERYWLLWILLHTGARREEIAQLSVNDVRASQEEHGIWFFHITTHEDEGRTVKNKHSKRRVPVHSALIALGFLDYLKQRKGEGQLLFPPSKKVKRKGKGGRPTPGDAVGKWFTRLRKLTGVTGRKLLHSFRHTVVTRLTSAGVPQDMREILVGHASSTVHGQVYTHREQIPLKLLQEHLEKLQYPEVV